MKTDSKPSLLRCCLGAAFFGLIGAASGQVPYPTPGVPVVNGEKLIVAVTGDVKATYLGSTAAFSDDLLLASPANGLGVIFNNHSTPVGTTVDLGTFTAGTELIFSEFVHNTGETYYTGPASRNNDNVVHAYVVDNYPASGSTFVGFEDLPNGGDFNYNDIDYTFTNTRASVPDVSATFSLLSMGLASLFVFARRIRK
jgi:hypothetical protein